ncbi:helix-turn-helix transcriptional regulator [Methanobrevibacter woesei]|uniref:helix-turn-helix transcriptional regulator n=1 Tax=Methanobrevibacter woesei TaxID=190976 RepID=UPI0026DFD5A0|nr:transcriptional regulator FilR1 domain-containing protein [Methanobrevibacter woesei]
MSKNENHEFKNIKYILTSTMRTKLIISIYEKEKNLEELRNELKKPSATILHGLKELENLNFVKKINKNYSLTSNGYLLAVNMLKLIENWYSINKNEIFWNRHDLKCIPKDLLKKLYQLKNSYCINSTNDDLSKALTTYIELLGESENLKIILPIFSEIHIENLLNLVEKGNIDNLSLITREEHPKFKEILNLNNVKVTTLNLPINIFLTCSDEFISLTLFFKDGHYDDSQLLIDRSEEGILWGESLFNHYKKKKKKIAMKKQMIEE